MTDETKLTPRERAEAQADKMIQGAADHVKLTAKRAVRVIPLYERAFEVIDALPEPFDDVEVWVSYDNTLKFRPCISEVSDVQPLLEGLSDQGFRLRAGMEIVDDERLTWELGHPEEKLKAEISAHFGFNAKCHIERVETGTETKEITLYETKVVCDEEEQDFTV